MKKYISIFMTLLFVFCLVGCSNKSINYIIKNKPSVTGIVEEVHDDYIIVYSENADGYPNGSNWFISLNVENKDSYTDVVVGDEIVFYYDGIAMETDPLQVNAVYAITLKTPADRTINFKETEDLMLLSDSFWESVTKIVFYDFGEEIYESFATEKLEDIKDIFAKIRYKEIENPELEGWYIFELQTKDNNYHLGITGQTINFNGKFYKVSDSIANEVVSILKTEGEDAEETIIYNGKEYLKSELCDATLCWLELSEQERMLSSYMPPEFMIFEETWGITLAAENVTPTSAIIKCTQSDGEPTGELHTGSWYILENWTQENGWKEIPYVIDGEIGWTQEAWTIPMENTCEWEMNWEWLYGKLPDGTYRIGKEITDFRDTGNYDTVIYYVEFTIKK